MTHACLVTLASTQSLLLAASSQGQAIGAFNVLHLETAEALVAGAEEAGRPIILQISENCVRFHEGLEAVAAASLTIAEKSTAQVAVHLDHAESAELAERAIDLGFSSVMFDGAKLPFNENVEVTRRIVAIAHNAGAAVEAELGEIGGKDGAHAPGVRTDPAEAVLFVHETGVDSLAVAVGSSHAMVDRSASIDLDLITRLKDAVPIPLVLHGSSGVSDDLIVQGISRGLVKINVSTHVNKVFTRAVRDYLAINCTVVDSRKYIAAGRDAMAVEVSRMLSLFAGVTSGRRDDNLQAYGA